jgi:hypothetical protein
MLLQCRPTLAHTLPLSLCLSTTLSCSLSFKRCCDTTNGINRNTDFSLSSSYHFKGYTYTKLLFLSKVGLKAKKWEKLCPMIGNKLDLVCLSYLSASNLPGNTCGLYYKLITIIIDATRRDAPNWSVTLTIVIDDTS